MSQTATDLSCWKCGTPLGELLLPLSRTAQCKHCHADLHSCCMCRFYDTTVSNSCREPIAEKVTEKKRSNFCGYFQPNPAAFQAACAKTSSTAHALNALFGMEAPAGAQAPAEDLNKRKLNELFGLDKKK